MPEESSSPGETMALGTPLPDPIGDVTTPTTTPPDRLVRRPVPSGALVQRCRSGRLVDRGSAVRRRSVADQPTATDVEWSGTDAPTGGPVRIVSKPGDVDREKEIERRLAELGLTEYKKRHERSIAEVLDAQITARDGLVAVLKRCRRRQRDPGTERDAGGRGLRPVDEIRNLVQQKIIRDAWGEKIAYEIRLFMGCFTKNVTYQTSGSVVDVQGASADVGGDNIKLTKDITVELPKSTDPTRITVTYVGGVVKIYAPVEHPWRRQTTGYDNRNEARQRPQFTSISPLYSLHMKLLASAN